MRIKTAPIGVLALAAMALWAPAVFAMDGQQDDAAECRTHLTKISIAVLMYLDRPGAQYPRCFAQMVEEGAVVDAAKWIFLCPADRTPRNLNGLLTSYDAVFDMASEPIGEWDTAQCGGCILAWDSEPRHGGKRNVVYFGTNVELVDEATFQKLLRRTKETLGITHGAGDEGDTDKAKAQKQE
jgi:prepilin-type processing-associated H-X9-DG protein